MGTSLHQKLSELAPKRQAKIQQRAQQLIEEEKLLRELIKLCPITQEKLAEILQVYQDGIAYPEGKSDLKVSTLTEIVRTMGGELRLVVEFPDRSPIMLPSLQNKDHKLEN